MSAYLVTGGARGLGRAMVLGLLKSGAGVVAADLSDASLRELRETALAQGLDGARLTLVKADVCSEEDAREAVRAAEQAFGGLDGLVNNAGIGQEQVAPDYHINPPPFWSVPVPVWRRIMEVNAVGPFVMTCAALPALRRRGGGRVVNVTTSLQTMLRKGMAPYAGSKAATEAHSLIMAQQLEGSGITVNVLVPGGPVDTDMVPSASGLARDALLRPEIMVAPLLWLLSPAASHVTGRRFVAAKWDASRSPEDAAALAGAPAAWPVPDDTVQWSALIARS